MNKNLNTIEENPFCFVDCFEIQTVEWDMEIHEMKVEFLF